MPCTDGGVPYPPSDAEIKRDRRLRRMEPLLCSACRILEGLGFDFDKNPELSEFWAEHKAEDAKRAAAEARVEWEGRVIAEALTKKFGDLTPEEKALMRKHGYFK